jgi:DNA-binding CsgD family transcriptional regulator
MAMRKWIWPRITRVGSDRALGLLALLARAWSGHPWLTLRRSRPAVFSRCPCDHELCGRPRIRSQSAAAGLALERALDLAKPDGALLWFLLHPAPGLLERQAGQRTAHAALIAEIRDLLAGDRPGPPRAGPRPQLDPLSKSEIRVLRYLPTHLSAPEIASELYVSTSTVKTTCATCTPNSARTAGPKRSSPPAPWACSHPPQSSADSGLACALTSGISRIAYVGPSL